MNGEALAQPGDRQSCPHCGFEWGARLGNPRYCFSCGSPLGIPPRSGAPGGELRFVTVLFADLADYTAFAEERAADEVAAVVGDLLHELGGVVDQYGGEVDKFIGDAVMATFGLRRPDPAAARNAVRAGLSMQKATALFADQHRLALALRVGVHTGEVLFRAVGARWTVLGDTVNTANSMQAAASRSRIWVSRSVYEEVRRHFTFITRPAVELPGKRRSIQPYEVVHERATPLSERPPFLGRAREWRKLRSALRDAVASRSLRVVAIRGAAGVGKSRLVWELMDWLQRKDVTYRVDVVQYDVGQRLPSHGLNSLIRGRFDLPVDLDDTTIVERLQAAMTREHVSCEPDRRELAAELFAFVLCVMSRQFHIQGMDGTARWDGVYVEIKQWIEGRAREAPWVWILEDAQKGDAPTAAFLDWALGMPWDAPVLVVLTIRDEDFGNESPWKGALSRWLGGGRAAEIRLRELPPQVLAKALLTVADGAMSEDVALRVAEHAEGNPLFATELMLLLKERDGAGSAVSLHGMTLPASIREVVEARLERLGVEGKDVAKRGAVVGRRFTREAVERIWDRPAAELERGIASLIASETVSEEASTLFAGEIELSFRHGRLQEAALAGIPRDDRRRWMQRLAAWALHKLDGLGEGWESGGAMLVPLIARSREEEGDVREASLWYEVLGLLHRKFHRMMEASDALSHAVAGASGTRRLVLARALAEAQRFAGDMPMALATVASAMVVSDADEDAYPVPAQIRDKLEPLATDPLERWGSLGRHEATVALLLTRAGVLTHSGNVEEARDLFGATQGELASVQGQAGVRLWLRWGQAYAYFLSELLGDPRAADGVRAAVHERIDMDDPALEDERTAFLQVEAYVEVRLGRHDRAGALTRKRLALLSTRKDRGEEASCWNALGLVHAAHGELDEAMRCYETFLTLSRTIGLRRGEAIALHNLAEAYLERGDWQAVKRRQQQYLSLSRAIGNRLAEAYAPAMLAAVAMEERDLDLAARHLASALECAEREGWQRLVALLRAQRGRLALLRRLARNDAGQVPLAKADLESAENGWSVDESAGEFACHLVVANLLSSDRAAAEASLRRARARTHDSQRVSWAWLDVAAALLSGRPPDDALAWFAEHGYRRPATFVEQLAAVL